MSKKFIASAIVAGFIVGVVSIPITLKEALEQSSVQNGAWGYNPMVGNPEASGYTRSAVAIVGFLGISKDESIYFLARHDEDEQLLSGSCTYRVSGQIDSADARCVEYYCLQRTYQQAHCQ